MLQLRHVCKSYTTGTFTQVALDDVSLSFRDNEFVSILGPSGSGKTTMLNIIGGLDHFDAGDLVIDGISTREYRDRDWDAYRNNRIGFVFQSYNLISHQTILANVELALTLSGVSPAERRERARQALADVGLGDHVNKRPSQLSGGQMQRVAIARALINDPEILLADEPTGALDSATSVQVMDLLREVAADRLVIMVTHNPELARQYSTRIVELADGTIRSDTDPFEPVEEDLRAAKPVRRTSMSFFTALALSFNNLMTKKGRTLMTAFAGSIGIIGIAAILALANGVNAYIQETEEETLSIYPLQIMSSGFDMTSMLMDLQGGAEDEGGPAADLTDQTDSGSSADPAASADAPRGGYVGEQRMVTSMFGSVGKNDLATLKEYLDGNGGGIDAHVQAIEYEYGVVPHIYSANTADGVQQVNPDTTFSAFGIGGSGSSAMASSAMFSTNVFSQMPEDLSLVENQFDVRAGRWPKAYDELVLVLSRSGRIADVMSYAMGLRDHGELEDMVQKLANEEDFEAPTDQKTFTLEEVMAPEFVVVPAASLYARDDEYNVWTSKADDEDFMRKLVDGGQRLRIVGVVQAREDVDATSLSQGIYYTSQLTTWLMDQAAESRIIKDQLADTKTNVITGKSFDAEAKERGNRFDMGSLFSIDQDKMAKAFKFDQESLDFSSLDLSGLDFSGLDLSGLESAFDMSSLQPSMDMDLSQLDLSQIEMPQIDFSQFEDLDFGDLSFDIGSLDLTGLDLGALLSPELASSLAPYLDAMDPVTLFVGVTPTVDLATMRETIRTLMQGLAPYLSQSGASMDDPAGFGRAVSEYFAQESVRTQLLDGLRGTVTFSDEAKGRIAQNIRDQIAGAELTEEERQNIDKATRDVAAKLADQVGSKFADQLATQLETQLSEAIATTLATTLQSYLGEVLSAVMTQMATALETQLADAIGSLMDSLTESLSDSIATTLAESMQEAMQETMQNLMSHMSDAFSIDEEAFAQAFSFNMDEKELSELMLTLMSTERTSYDNNLAKLGYASKDKPSQINIYPVNFDSKAEVIAILDGYNDRMREEDDSKVITYTDIVGALMSSVTDIVNMISYVLIAFVAISLIVSSIMIGVITYISVLERKKEIGILRSIGASKRDVSRVFNAETVIEGLVSGVMGVGITALACIPANIIVESNFDVDRVARLPVGAAMVLVGVSVFLSFVAGVIPSRKAAKADPVEALRSE